MANTVIKKWRDENIILGYEYAKQGMSVKAMAEAMGVARITFRGWLKDKPTFKMAISMGRSAAKKSNGDTFNFQDYVYKRLDKKLRKVWDKMREFEEEKNGMAKVEALLEKKGKRVRQALFIHALVATNFNTGEALRRCCVPASQFRSWCDHDPDFLALFQEIDWHKKNFFEGALMQQVARGDSAATLFVNRTANRDRGYNEKVDLNVSGSIDHNINLVSVDSLDLDLETKKKLLKAVRKAKA